MPRGRREKRSSTPGMIAGGGTKGCIKECIKGRMKDRIKETHRKGAAVAKEPGHAPGGAAALPALQQTPSVRQTRGV